MKIAILTQSYPPMISGAALFAERLAGNMSRRGHEVLVLAASERAYPYRLSRPNLTVARCQSCYNPLRVGQRFALWPYRQITNCLAEFSPDLIHIHDPLQFGFSSLSFARSRKVPVIFTIHQLPWFINTYFQAGKCIQQSIEKGLWRYARWMLAQTTGVAATRTVAEEIYAHTGIYPHVISCGVDLNAFFPGPCSAMQAASWREKLGIPDAAPIILHVGRLDKDKQVDKVVQAAAVTLWQTPAHLLVVGDGTEKVHLEHLCARAGVGERCHFPGFISARDGLAALYQMAAVCVTASEIETQGLVLLEATACGLPIVAVKSTCLHELVHEGINGFLLQPGDIVGMAKRLCELVQNPLRAQQMGKIGRLIVENHAAEKTIDAYEDVYYAAVQQNLFISFPEAAVPGRAAHSGGSG